MGRSVCDKPLALVISAILVPKFNGIFGPKNLLSMFKVDASGTLLVSKPNRLASCRSCCSTAGCVPNWLSKSPFGPLLVEATATGLGIVGNPNSLLAPSDLGKDASENGSGVVESSIF